MSEQLAIALGGLFAILVNLVAIAWSVRQTNLQRKDTENLARLTSRLQNEVNRLSRELDQILGLLHRALELNSAVYVILQQFHFRGSGGRDDETVAKYWASVSELAALSTVIGDDELIKACGVYREIFETMAKAVTVKQKVDTAVFYWKTATAVNQRIYELQKEVLARGSKLAVSD